MTGYTTNIEKDSLANQYFRKVLYTAPNLQLVLMTLQSGEEIGLETHDHGDQFFRVEGGTGDAILDGETYPLADGDIVVIPAGVEHNIVNTSSDTPLHVYTIYTPPEHPDGTINETKADAVEYEKTHGH
jgi:mannose-6-phosphate isomerase-like protein (cupin superfamily)